MVLSLERAFDLDLPPLHQPTRDFVVKTSKSWALHSDKTIAFFSIFLFVQYFKHKELGPRLKWA